jgi:predicted nucleic acid-binding protein
MTVVDASVLVSVYHASDAFHQLSIEWLQQYSRSGAIIVVPLLVLSEVAGSIARQTSDPYQGREAVRQLRALPNLVLVPVDERLATLSAQLAADLRLKGADAIYVAVVAQLDLPLISWDREQIERGGRLVTAQRPDGS